MERLELLISLIAIVLSSVSIFIVIWRTGLGLGLEFVEKKEIRELKKNSEELLKLEWRVRLEKFISGYDAMKKTADEETIDKEFSDLGESARLTILASAILKIISKTSSQFGKSVLFSIGTLLLLIATAWGSYSYPTLWSGFQNPSYNWAVFVVVEIIALALFLRIAQKNWRDYTDIRSYFYDLSEKPSLLKAKEISSELRIKDIDIP